MPIDPKEPADGWFWFRGGATLILDTRKSQCEVRYSIIKNSGSAAVLERQRATYAQGTLSPLRELYFGEGSSGTIRDATRRTPEASVMAKAKSGTQPQRGNPTALEAKERCRGKRACHDPDTIAKGIGDCHLLRFPTGGGDRFLDADRLRRALIRRRVDQR